MPEDITNDSPWPHELHSEWVCFIERRSGHRQTDHNAGAFIERLWRKHEQRMNVLHFPANLRITIDPNHVPSIWRPTPASLHQTTSFPTRVAAITSPP